MKKLFTIPFIASLAFIMSCFGQGESFPSNLAPAEFNQKIKELPKAPLIDVRTPDEFSKGHIQNAINIDWNGSTFDQQTAGYDKSAPLLIYCLSGGRSGSAAAKLRAQGFKNVIEMSGGMMKWRAANLPEVTANQANAGGMTMENYNALLQNKKIVLIDFYADWCAPCKKMKPFLEEISKENTNTEVIRINADDHAQLCQELGIDALPVVILYKNQKQIWKNVGFTSKQEIVKRLK